MTEAIGFMKQFLSNSLCGVIFVQHFIISLFSNKSNLLFIFHQSLNTVSFDFLMKTVSSWFNLEFLILSFWNHLFLTGRMFSISCLVKNYSEKTLCVSNQLTIDWLINWIISEVVILVSVFRKKNLRSHSC